MLSGMTKTKAAPNVNTNRYDPYKTYRFLETAESSEQAKVEKKPAKKAAKKK